MKNSHKKTIGVYAGSFSPFHIGHADIVRQAVELFDRVIVAVGVNSEKSQVDKEPLPNLSNLGVEQSNYNGLLADYLNFVEFENDDSEVFLIRGLRNGEDLQHEQNQLQYIKDMYPSLKTVFFICDKKVEHISSSSLRALKKVSPNDYIKYVI